MKTNQFRGALATILGVALVAGAIGTSQAETNPAKPTGTGTSAPSKPTKKTPATTAAESNTPAAATESSTIVELASSSQQFKTLVAAVKAAGLVETLSGPGPFTLFAPNDEAFAKLPKGTLQKLLKPENKTALQQVLKYHLLSKEVAAKDVKSGSVDTVAGKSIKIIATKKAVMINNAKVLKTDVKASNGIIHTIDTVLIPPGLKIK
jgi:uncharacterized surface protein with fasciclin (FAS1) repeats